MSAAAKPELPGNIKILGLPGALLWSRKKHFQTIKLNLMKKREILDK